jgi:hypothetical protein
MRLPVGTLRIVSGQDRPGLSPPAWSSSTCFIARKRTTEASGLSVRDERDAARADAGGVGVQDGDRGSRGREADEAERRRAGGRGARPA